MIRAMSFEDAVKLLLVSFDSTIKANLSVGLPLDMQVYEAEAISSGWGEALKDAFHRLPPYTLD
jgi:putative proteasome-type protease